MLADSTGHKKHFVSDAEAAYNYRMASTPVCAPKAIMQDAQADRKNRAHCTRSFNHITNLKKRLPILRLSNEHSSVCRRLVSCADRVATRLSQRLGPSQGPFSPKKMPRMRQIEGMTVDSAAAVYQSYLRSRPSRFMRQRPLRTCPIHVHSYAAAILLSFNLKFIRNRDCLATLPRSQSSAC
jgi:hypothetical protein